MSILKLYSNFWVIELEEPECVMDISRGGNETPSV
jgi:hypothetical protein